MELPESCPPAGPTATIFVTHDTYSGSLGGFGGADNICQAAADSTLQITGNYKVWLSSNTADARDRLIHFDGALRLPNGILIAANWDDFVDGVLYNPINVTQFAQVVGGSVAVWTGTDTDGTWLPDTSDACNNWTLFPDDAVVRAGVFTNNDAAWTSALDEQCAFTEAHLYCIQQIPLRR